MLLRMHAGYKAFGHLKYPNNHHSVTLSIELTWKIVLIISRFVVFLE